MPLAEFFREIANQELERNIKGFNASARNVLLTCPWPGNVRELKQKIFTAVLQAEDTMVTEEDLELNLDSNTALPTFALKNVAEEKERILQALKQADGNRRIAARLLGIGRTTLYRKMEEYGLKYEFRQP